MPNGDKNMKRISHITDITALKNADLPILSITPITNHNQIPLTHHNNKSTEKHTQKNKTILKTAQTKRNSTQKKEVPQKLKEQNEPYAMNKNRMNKAIRHPY